MTDRMLFQQKLEYKTCIRFEKTTEASHELTFMESPDDVKYSAGVPLLLVRHASTKKNEKEMSHS